jgi:hypothetical protein
MVNVLPLQQKGKKICQKFIQIFVMAEFQLSYKELNEPRSREVKYCDNKYNK